MIRKYLDHTPQIDDTVFVADTAEVIGSVKIGADSSIWFNATLRGDIAEIVIGERTSIQDNIVVHVNYDTPTIIGNDVTIGHGAIIHSAEIEDNCMIGMGAILLDGVKIGHGSIIAAGCVVSPRTVIPPYSQVMGVPGRVVKQLDEAKEQELIEHAQGYVEQKNKYLSQDNR